MNRLWAFAALLALIGPDSLGAERTWTDASGKFSVQAEFVQVRDGKVDLKKENGNIITAAVTRLSEEDQQFVMSQSFASNVLGYWITGNGTVFKIEGNGGGFFVKVTDSSILSSFAASVHRHGSKLVASRCVVVYANDPFRRSRTIDWEMEVGANNSGSITNSVIVWNRSGEETERGTTSNAIRKLREGEYEELLAKAKESRAAEAGRQASERSVSVRREQGRVTGRHSTFDMIYKRSQEEYVRSRATASTKKPTDERYWGGLGGGALQAEVIAVNRRLAAIGYPYISKEVWRKASEAERNGFLDELSEKERDYKKSLAESDAKFKRFIHGVEAVGKAMDTPGGREVVKAGAKAASVIGRVIEHAAENLPAPSPTPPSAATAGRSAGGEATKGGTIGRVKVKERTKCWKCGGTGNSAGMVENFFNMPYVKCTECGGLGKCEVEKWKDVERK